MLRVLAFCRQKETASKLLKYESIVKKLNEENANLKSKMKRKKRDRHAAGAMAEKEEDGNNEEVMLALEIFEKSAKGMGSSKPSKRQKGTSSGGGPRTPVESTSRKSTIKSPGFPENPTSPLPALTMKPLKSAMKTKGKGGVSPSIEEIAASHEWFVGNGIIADGAIYAGVKEKADVLKRLDESSAHAPVAAKEYNMTDYSQGKLRHRVEKAGTERPDSSMTTPPPFDEELAECAAAAEVVPVVSGKRSPSTLSGVQDVLSFSLHASPTRPSRSVASKEQSDLFASIITTEEENLSVDARLVDINLASKKNGHPYPEGPPHVKLVFSRSKPLERSSLNVGEQAGFASAEIKTPTKMSEVQSEDLMCDDDEEDAMLAAFGNECKDKTYDGWLDASDEDLMRQENFMDEGVREELQQESWMRANFAAKGI